MVRTRRAEELSSSWGMMCRMMAKLVRCSQRQVVLDSVMCLVLHPEEVQFEVSKSQKAQVARMPSLTLP